MQFKSFIWPNEPTSFSIQEKKNTAVHTFLNGTWEVELIGRTPRVFTGEGVFFGESAYDTFERLRGVFQSDGAGTLSHPQWGNVNACFTELEMTQPPRDHYVQYRFTFLEAGQ